MTTSYSGTPLQKKLNLKPGFAAAVVNPPADYWQLLGALPEGVVLHTINDERLNWVHIFVTRREELADLLVTAHIHIVPNGIIWVSWPKQSAKVATNISEDLIRDMALASGLVDVKVCAVDATWSGLKLVIPVKDRRG